MSVGKGNQRNAHSVLIKSPDQLVQDPLVSVLLKKIRANHAWNYTTSLRIEEMSKWCTYPGKNWLEKNFKLFKSLIDQQV